MAVFGGQILVHMSAFDFVISSCSTVHRCIKMVAVGAEVVFALVAFAFVACVVVVVVVEGPCYN